MQWQQQWLWNIVELGKAHAIFFNIFTNAKYYHMKVVSDETNLFFSIVGLGMFIRKSYVLSIEKIYRMLAQLMCQPTFPSSLNLKFGYICMQNFFTRGCSKLHIVDLEEFSLLSLPTSVVLKYCQGIFKNWKIDIIKCFAN